jgi:hypothetical protein
MLSALCEACGTLMYRRINPNKISSVLPGVRVLARQAQQRIAERPKLSLNSALKEA